MSASTVPPASTVDEAAAADNPRRRRILRWVGFLVSLAIVVTAGFLVPMPLAQTSLGSATTINPLVAVDGDTTALTGEFDLLTVRVGQPSFFETVRAALDDDRRLEPRNAVIPASIDRRRYFELQDAEFRRSFDVAAAVALDAAGLPVQITTRAEVVNVLPGSPADGNLQLGDRFRTVLGQPVTTHEDVVALTRNATSGQALAMQVERDGVLVDVEVVAGAVPGLDRPGMGITLQTLETDIVLPREVELLDQRGIGGPSAGMMVALTIYDLVADEDLAAGRRIAGTGTLDGDGTVGRIGSVREKTLTAIAAGAELLIVPASQAAEATSAAAGRIEVIGVSSLLDAIEALRP